MPQDLWIQIVIGLAVALIAGVIGAGYQQYRRRSRPFVLVKTFGGTAVRRNSTVEIAPDIVSQAASSIYLHRLKSESHLSDIDLIQEQIKDLQSRGPSSCLCCARRSLLYGGRRIKPAFFRLYKRR